MVKKRKCKRYIISLRVFEQESEALLGFTANLHKEGMMVMTEKLIPINNDINVLLGLKTMSKVGHTSGSFQIKLSNR